MKTIHLEEPDRVPTFTTLTLRLLRKLERIRATPWPEDSFLSTRISHTEILLQLGNARCGRSWSPLREKGKETKRLPDGTSLVDEFGIVYQRVG